MGHARSLITLNEPSLQVAILRQILDKQLSVRQVEDMVRTAGSSKSSVKNLKKLALPEKFESVKSELRQKFQVPVELKVKPNGSGQITFTFRSEEDFQKIITSFDI